MNSMRIITDLKRYRPCPSGKIKRLFRIHGEHGNIASVIDTGWIVVASLAQLAIANHDIIRRADGDRTVAPLQRCRGRPAIVLLLTKIHATAYRAGHAPDIGVKVASAACYFRI